MKSIVLFLVYYGTLPNYFNLWLKAAEFNTTVDFCIISDCVSKKYVIPKNVRVLDLSFAKFKEQVQSKFDFQISIENYARISQFRPALGYIFPEEICRYDYWGYIECDLIFGDIRKFLTDHLLNQYEKFFKLGHFQVFRNNSKMNTLFMKKSIKALNYKFTFSQNVAFFEELVGMQNLADAYGCKTYTESVYADIKAYHYMFVRSRFGYKDGIEKECIGSFENGHVFCHYLENDTIRREEVLYMHLQKRNMEVKTGQESSYMIIPNAFIEKCAINIDMYQKIKQYAKGRESEYQNRMATIFSDIKKNHNRNIYWWKLRVRCMRIKMMGGYGLDGNKLFQDKYR